MGGSSETEEWRPVVGFPGYDVSSLGRVRSWRPYRGDTGPRIRKEYIGDLGYPIVSLSGPGGRTVRRLYRLVAEAFLGPRAEGAEVRHLNGVKTDNRVENLRYGTRSENTKDRVRHGEHHLANRTHCPQGHPYSEENTRVVRVGGKFRHRACKTCEAQWQREKRVRHRGRVA